MENEYLSDITYPSEEEIRTAQLLCCGRVCKECEVPAAYALRKREVDMALLLEKVIEDELTEAERSVVKDRWYNSLSFSQIARNNGVSAVAVRNTSERALEKIERALKYVVFYQRDITEESIVPAVVGRAMIIASARNTYPEDICSRIKKLRLSQGYSIRRMSAATGMSRKRIVEIEKGDVPKIDEIIMFSKFFAASTDYILKGERNV